MEGNEKEITSLARRWRSGDPAALDRLIELTYDDLRRIARRHLRLGQQGGTIDTTSLVHEAYLKLAGSGGGGGEWLGRAQFYAFCSQAMRRILIDYARQAAAAKRGGGMLRVPLDTNTAVLEREAIELLALDDALKQLEARAPQMVRVVECRFFAGLSVGETAEALSVSSRTVERDWSRARAYLRQLLGPGEGRGQDAPEGAQPAS
jgi:RNA polymerase sigma factor (TIGR02999 family)